MYAKKEISEILSKPYQRDIWIEFMRQTFGGSYRMNAPQIAVPSNEIAENCYEVGQFETSDGMLVGIYEVKIKEGISIENKRVGLRNLLRSVYRVVDAALVVFDTGEAWRFSFVSEIYTRDEAGNRQAQKTDPKRYTYVLGTGGGVRTASDRFEVLANKNQQIKLKDLLDAFSVEILTKTFYRDLSDWYFWALSKVKFPNDAEPNDELRNATSVIRLITRLIFVWFLKQKHLVPDELFDEETLKKILKNFNPNTLRSLGEADGNSYYKAILQNLFFATLNTEMTDDKRKFINRQTGVQGFYRYERYFQDKDLFLALTKEVPFLNGGLFENLDRNVGEADEKRIDCFSNKLANESRLSVPDYLFFGEDVADLSGVYDDKKRKKVTVKGIINILKSYNFTVEENTPTDIEVALDPELLGKVFENLLASYNPETKTTARKQTGSFYTPREIVEYMVDESLKAYLNEQLSKNIQQGFVEFGKKQANLFGNEGKKGQLDLVAPVGSDIAPTTGELSLSVAEGKLNTLFSYDSEENPFNAPQTQVLIRAIDQCRILDPACGSGAFPMGILQRLVFLLRKLDPQNIHWRERQIKRATKEFEEAIRRGQNIDLQEQINEITSTFQNNSDDYGRKLYLIENCIYGVDIQPIAVQIAKLRFFISLMAEQNASTRSEIGLEKRSLSVAEANRGIRPLPNLETKFVAANTLIGLEKPVQLLLKNTKIDTLEKQLEEVRHKHFFARTPETKKKYRLKDQEIRNDIADLLKVDGWKPTSANQVAAWNPYDQNAYAPFFDPEWMFGIIDGFDIVIGNPPYFQLQKIKLEAAILKKQGFETFESMGDLYCLFYEKGLSLLKNSGNLNYITSNKWMRAEYGRATRKYLDKFSPLILIDFGSGVFESATVDTNILLIKKEKKPKIPITKSLDLTKIKNIISFNLFKDNWVPPLISADVWAILDPIEAKLKTKIEKIGKPLKLWDIQINYGVKTGYNEAFIIDTPTKENICKEDAKSINIIKPILRGRDIKRYKAEWASFWLITTFPSLNINIEEYPAVKKYLSTFGKRLFQTGESFIDENGIKQSTRKKTNNQWFETQDQISYYKDFEKEKIIYPNMTLYLPFILDDQKFYSNDKSFILNSRGPNLKFIVGYLNSKIATKWIRENCPELQGGTRELRKVYFENIPIPNISNENQQPFIYLVDYILELKKQSGSEADLMSSYFEQIVDGLVYELYFGEELHAANIYFHKHLQNLQPVDKVASLGAVFAELYAPTHPVRAGLFRLDTVEEVAIIEGKGR